MQKILFIHDHKNDKSAFSNELKKHFFSVDHAKQFKPEFKNRGYSALLFYYNGTSVIKRSIKSTTEHYQDYPIIILSDQNNFNELELIKTNDNIIDFITDPFNNLELLIYKTTSCIKIHKQQQLLKNELLLSKQKVESLTNQTAIGEKKFNSVFNSYDKASFFINPTGEILNSNSSASKLFGFSKKELLGKNLIESINNKKNKIILSDLSKLTNQKCLKFKSFVTHKNNSKIDVECSFTSIPVNEIRIIHATVKDISKQENEFGAIKDSTLESANDGIILIDPKLPGKPIVFSNSRFAALSGYNKKEIIGQKVSFVYGGKTNPKAAKEINEAIANHGSYKGEVLHHKKDGSLIWNYISLNPIFNEDKKLTHYILIIKDITNRKRIDKELDEYKKFFSVGNDMFGIASTDGYFKKVNKSFLRTLGYSEKELLERPFMDFVHPMDRADTAKEEKKLADGKTTVNFDNRYRCKNGSYKYLRWCVTPDTSTGLLFCSARDITESKISSIALEHSEKNLKESQKIAQLGSWETYIESHEVVLWSQELYKIFGFRWKEKVTIEKILERTHPEDKDKVFWENWTKIPNNKSRKTEYRIFHPTKGEIYIYSSGLTVKNEKGKVHKIIGISQDITERKKTEMKLLENQQKWLSLFHNSSDKVQVLDNQFNVININQFSKDILKNKISVKSYLGSNYFDFISNGYELKEVVIKKLKSSKNVHFNHKGVLSDRYFKCNIVPLISNNQKEGYIVIETDVTEEKNQELKLIESENRLQRAIELAPIPIMIHDEDGKVHRISQGWKNYSGYSLNEISTIEKWTKLAFGKEKVIDKDYIDNLFTYNETFNNGESEITDRRGKKRIWNFHSTPLGYTEDGKRLILNTAVDLSKSKAAENEVRRLNKNLELAVEERTKELQNALIKIKKTQSQLIQQEKMASLGLLTAGLAHEINNPMNFIYAGINNLERIINDIQPIITRYNFLSKGENIELDLEKIEKSKQANSFEEKINTIPELLSDIKLGAERATEVVKGLRTFSRIDKDRKRLYNLHEGLDSSLMLLRGKLNDKIIIKKKYSDKIDMVKCFPSQLNQVFLNIIGNAIEATEGKGRITIETSIPYGKVVISIKDNGMGMTKKTKNKIFDPFYTTKEVGKGLGLGLSITYGIIEKHGGEILVITAPKRGTEFRIILPRS
ncbi:PAS domain S-box protein [Reichenbachiella sp. MALMAid0571]|uniref:PAS domain S-box protein n=1 Tax=Reichenbachiella sp. MALMAid0571 TaxID=3143939 RepID=UPI0032DF687F